LFIVCCKKNKRIVNLCSLSLSQVEGSRHWFHEAFWEKTWRRAW
jgi:hypothetical protein